MDLSKGEDDRFKLSVSSDENQAIRRALTLWGGRADLPATAAARQLLTTAALIDANSSIISGFDSDTILTLSDALKEYQDHTKRYVGRIAGRLENLDKPTTVSVNSELGQAHQIGNCAGQLALDLAFEHNRLTNPAPDFMPADWAD